MKLDSIMPKRVDPALISFVKTAFDQKISGSDKRYEVLTKLITSKSDINALLSLLDAASQCMNYFESHDSCLSGFLMLIFQIRWELNLDIAKCCCSFATGVAAINGKYYPAIYSMLIKSLISDYEDQSESKREIDDLVHETIQNVLKIAPLSSTSLFQVYQDLFPHSSANVELQTYYLRNLLKTLDYATMIRDKSIAIIIEKLTAIDVEIHIDDSQLSKKGVINNHGHQGLSDDDRNSSEDDNDEDNVFQAVWDVEKKTEEDEESIMMAEKLDQMMILMFNYIDNTRKEGTDALDKLFHTLQRYFECSVMLTHKSKHVQFLLFYICQFNHSYIEQFVGRMIDWICSEEAIPLYRQTCAAYCASYICRAQYIELDVVKSVLYYLIHWTQAYIDVYNRQENPLFPGSEGHKVFYSIVQSICYIMCFCGRKIYFDESGKQFIKQWKWREIMDSSLEPLRYCISSITTEFIYLSMELDLIDFTQCHTYYIEYLYTYLHSNDLEMEIQNSKKKTIGRGENPLDSFFPYDPYLLRDSYRYIKDIYIDWEDVIDNDDKYVKSKIEDESSSEDSNENDINVDHELSNILESSLAQSFAMSLEQTPGNHVLLASRKDSYDDHTNSYKNKKNNQLNSKRPYGINVVNFGSDSSYLNSNNDFSRKNSAQLSSSIQESEVDNDPEGLLSRALLVQNQNDYSEQEDNNMNAEDSENDINVHILLPQDSDTNQENHGNYDYDSDLVELSFTRTRKASDYGSW